LEVNQRRNTKQQLSELSGPGGSGHRSGTIGIEESLLSIFDEHSSGFRDLDFLASALEQFHAEFFLHVSDLLAEGGLGNTHTFSSPREVQLIADSDDVAHGAEFYPRIQN